MRRRYICWDLDETLGSFRDYSRMRMMKGIRPLIESLSEKGIGHVVTTAAGREHAEHVLSHFSIGEHFGHIFDCGMICDPYYNKYYGPVAAALGIKPAEAPDSLLVVGNLIRDSPSDLDLVFVYLPEMAGAHAQAACRASGAMNLLLEGSFAGSFERLAAPSGVSVRNSVFSGTASGSLIHGRAIFPKPQPPGGTRLISDVHIDENYEEKKRDAA